MLLASVPQLTTKWDTTGNETLDPPADADDGPLEAVDDDHFVATRRQR
jgi:hypothetical protein